MHIFGADISTVCGFDLKYDTTLLKSWAKKLIINPTKMRPWRKALASRQN